MINGSPMCIDVNTFYIVPGCHWVCGYAESFQGNLRDKVLK